MTDIEIWNKNSDVNLKFTKKVNVPGKTPFTNIDTYELLRMATEQFGSYGKGFGIKEMSWSERQVEDTTLLVLDSVFFFPGGEFPYRTSLKSIYKAKAGYMVIDEDAPKKLITNTIAKCLSMIGFGASVYLGLWEDEIHMNELVHSQIVVVSQDEVNKLLQGISYYKIDKAVVLSHFGLSHLKDLPKASLEEAKAFIKEIGGKKDGNAES